MTFLLNLLSILLCILPYNAKYIYKSNPSTYLINKIKYDIKRSKQKQKLRRYIAIAAVCSAAALVIAANFIFNRSLKESSKTEDSKLKNILQTKFFKHKDEVKGALRSDQLKDTVKYDELSTDDDDVISPMIPRFKKRIKLKPKHADKKVAIQKKHREVFSSTSSEGIETDESIDSSKTPIKIAKITALVSAPQTGNIPEDDSTQNLIPLKEKFGLPLLLETDSKVEKDIKLDFAPSLDLEKSSLLGLEENNLQDKFNLKALELTPSNDVNLTISPFYSAQDSSDALLIDKYSTKRTGEHLDEPILL